MKKINKIHEVFNTFKTKYKITYADIIDHISNDLLNLSILFIKRKLTYNYDDVKWAISKTWTQTLDPNPEKPGPRKTWTQKNLDPGKPGPRKTWTLKNMDPEKHGINIGLKNMSDFR